MLARVVLRIGGSNQNWVGRSLNAAKIFSISLIVAITALAQPAVATLIGDHYVGHDGHDEWDYGDVIGGSNFQIHDAEVTLSGNWLNVVIRTNFAGQSGDLFRSYTVGGAGLGHGDLFLASVWDPYGDAPYVADDASTGTAWDYVFSLDDRFDDPSESARGVGTLYDLNHASAPPILLSNDFMTRGRYREGQEVGVDTGAPGASDAIVGNPGNWWVDENAAERHLSTVHFAIDLTNTDLLNGPEIAFHWGFTCQNDVIEGAISVGEPATLGLFGMALLGLGFVTRRRRRSV